MIRRSVPVLAFLLACDGVPAHEQGGDTAAVQLSVTQAPLDARCVRVTIDSATGPQSATRFVDTVPGGSTTVVLGGLPTGLLRLFGEGFDATCATVGTGTSLPSTWVSDVVEATLAAGSTVDVTLSMRRPGSANVAIDFDSPPPPLVEFPLGIPAAGDLAAASDGSIVVIARMPGVVARFSGGITTTLVNIGTELGHVAIAADDTIWVSRSNAAPGVVHLDTAGVVLGLWGFGVGSTRTSDLVIDPDGRVWVSMRDVNRLAIVDGGVLSVPFIPERLSGLAVGPDGFVTASVLTRPQVMRFNEVGQPMATLNTPFFANDVAIDPLGQTWVLDAGSSRVVRVGGPLAPIPSPPPLGEMLALPNGTLLVSAPVDGRIWSVSQGGVPQLLFTLPAGARPGAMTRDGAGQVWVADQNAPRLFRLTLP